SPPSFPTRRSSDLVRASLEITPSAPAAAMVEPIAPAKNKTAKTDFIVFIFLTSFPANSWPSSYVTGQQGEKFPSKKILLSGIFRVDTKSPQSLNDVD